jgi:hypothetical protein
MARALGGDRVVGRARWRRAAAAVAAVFGVATVVSGGRVLFGGGAAGAGAYVPFVVAFNFAAGFAYVAAALALGRRWGARLAGVIAAATVLVFAAFGVHVATGGAYEPRTVGAMALRSVFWVALAAFAPRWVAPRR